MVSEAFQSIHFDASGTTQVLRLFFKSRNHPLNCLSSLQRWQLITSKLH